MLRPNGIREHQWMAVSVIVVMPVLFCVGKIVKSIHEEVDSWRCVGVTTITKLNWL